MGDVLVAASAYSDYPPQAARLEQVASWQGINLERVLALKPDLILAWRGGNPQRVLDQLAAFGIPIFYADADTLEGIAGLLDKLAQYSPHPEQAHQAAEGLRRQFAALKQQYAANPARRVLLQFGTQPLFTSAGATLQSQVLALCGGRTSSPTAAPLAANQPRAGAGASAAGHHHRRRERSRQWKAFWAPQLQVPVIALNEDWFNRGGPRILLAAQQLCRQLAEIR
ncbi:vitamin B12 ABC transporter substrate-binding protein BtuF [Serratia ureilytica]